MTDKNCPICFGMGWICENHPDKAWDEKLGCMCSAGMPCECNSVDQAGLDEPDTSQVIEERDIREH